MCGTYSAVYLSLPHATVLRCTNQSCELEFCATQPAQQDLATSYHELYYPTEGTPAILGTPECVFRTFLDAIARRFGPLQGQSFLDFGSGDGSLCRVASSYGMVPTGIDFDGNARAMLRTVASCEAYADLAELRSRRPDAEFDCITMWNVIEHLREPWKELAELRSLLRRGARIFVTTPNARSLKSTLLKSRWDQRLNPTHFYYFHPKSLMRLLQRTGFDHIQPIPVPYAYPQHGIARRALHKALAACNLQGEMIFCATTPG